MSTEIKTNLRLEIAHILFIDVVSYSKLSVNEQSELLQELNDTVLRTEQVRAADAANQLIRLPTGDGMALVFRNYPEAAAECALEIAAALKSHPEIQVRMGVHSGPVNEVTDVNQRANIAGAGVNMAQRVMGCGDAGHILLSKRVADDLAHYRQWRPLLHDLGEVEVKHGERISIVNLFTDELGNSDTPEKLKRAMAESKAISLRAASSRRRKATLISVMIFGTVAVVAALLLLSQRAKSKLAAAVSVSSIIDKSIAVLPFENFSADPENAFFADGMQDDILTALAKIADLKVISRTSVMSYRAGASRNLREIAQALGVAHVLEGSVRLAGGKMRVTAQLIDARNDTHLWADTYDREVTDIFGIQSEIALKIAEQLQAKLSAAVKSAIGERPTQDLTAYGLYVKANSLLLISLVDKQNLLAAERLLDQAVERDRNFFLAHCALVQVRTWLYRWADHTPARKESARVALDAVLRLRPDAGEAHLAKAMYASSCDLDYGQARAEIALAQRTLPGSAASFQLLAKVDKRQGLIEDAVRHWQKAVELDPLNTQKLRWLFWDLLESRRYPEAARTIERALAIDPKEPGARVLQTYLELDWRADTKPLHEVFKVLENEDPASASMNSYLWLELALCERDPVAANRALPGLDEGLSEDALTLPGGWFRGLAARSFGDDAAARNAFTAARVTAEQEVRNHPDFGPPLCVLGLIDAGLGRKEEAIREGRRASELCPTTKDALNGGHIMGYLAMIYAWTEEKDLAFAELAAALRSPHRGWSYGQLRLNPSWDALRGDPRFEKLVANLAPKPGE